MPRSPDNSPALDPARLWPLLNELADRLGVEVRLENLEGGEEYLVKGGLCRLGHRQVAFVERRAAPAARSRQLGRALLAMDLEGVYLRPAVRNFLGRLGPEPEEE